MLPEGSISTLIHSTFNPLIFGSGFQKQSNFKLGQNWDYDSCFWLATLQYTTSKTMFVSLALFLALFLAEHGLLIQNSHSISKEEKHKPWQVRWKSSKFAGKEVLYMQEVFHGRLLKKERALGKEVRERLDFRGVEWILWINLLLLCLKQWPLHAQYWDLHFLKQWPLHAQYWDLHFLVYWLALKCPSKSQGEREEVTCLLFSIQEQHVQATSGCYTRHSAGGMFPSEIVQNEWCW